MAQLRVALRAAKAEGDQSATADLRAKVTLLRGFGAQHIHKQDPELFTGGFVVLGVGVAAIAGGATAFFVGAFSNCQSSFFFFPSCSGDSTAMIGGGIAMGVGAMLALASIPMIVAGSKKVFEAPRVVVGPARVGGSSSAFSQTTRRCRVSPT